MSAIQAVFTNTKRIASRKAYQIILEVPEENQGHVHSVLGWPKSDGSVWVGVARIIKEEHEEILAFLKSEVNHD